MSNLTSVFIGTISHFRPRGQIIALPAVSQTIKLTKHSSEVLMFVTGSKAVGGDYALVDACFFSTFNK